ncbi:MAG: asparagine--tRNA ligase [Candidatus Pacearchaeota archaeon]|nr:asparagine--tRNA ligase [Candidatus Pacearchaeota archaeon]
MKEKTKFISIQEALDKGKGVVAIRGWAYRETKMKDKMFIVLRDSSNIIQCVIKKEIVSEQEWNDLQKLLMESSLELEGSVREDKRSPTGHEVDVSSIEVIGYAEPFPITKEINEDLLLDRRHLWLRSRKMTAIMKIRSTVFGAYHEYFRNKGFYEFQSPLIIPGGAEEGPTLFEVKYGDKKAYLAQTWQLYAESAMFALEKIYTMAPSFRAEKSKTSRHLTEYWHAEMEVAWADLNEIMDYAEELVKHIVKRVLEKNKEELNILERDTKKLEPTIKKRFPRITYDEALKTLKDKFKIPIKWGDDIKTLEEDKLMELNETPLFVTHYPKDLMAFYKPRDKKNPKAAVCFDLLAPEGNHEIMGGSERDTDIKELIKTLKSKGEKIEDYQYYLDTRKYGSIPHAGFGMGTDRLIKWICGLDNIKDAIAFPRTPGRCTP